MEVSLIIDYQFANYIKINYSHFLKYKILTVGGIKINFEYKF